MQLHYVIPFLMVIIIIAYSIWMRKRIATVTPEQAEQQFQEAYAGYFDLQEGEKVIGAWSGVEFQGPASAAKRLAGDALNSAAAVVGVSAYVPNVQVGLSSSGRVLISREHSELGKRGHFEQLTAFDPGTRAVGDDTAYPGEDLGTKPKNPFNPVISLEFVQLRSPNGEIYDAWLSPQGAHIGQKDFCSILTSLI